MKKASLQLCFFLGLLAPALAARKCEPETRCINSPDLGITSTSTFFAPKNATSEQLKIFQSGMEHARPDGSCVFGHTDLAGTQRALDETKKCFDYEGFSCGIAVTNYMCTCASKERVRASYDNSGLLGGAIVLCAFGCVFLFAQCFFTLRDYINGDLDLPGCDCSEPGVSRFWMTILVSLILPTFFLGGATWAFVEAFKDPELPTTWGYWQGCGTYTFLNAANPGGQVFIAFFSTLILLMFCSCFYSFFKDCFGSGQRNRRADELQRQLRARAAGLRSDIEDARAAGSSTVTANAARGSRPALRLQRSATQLGSITLELAHPTRAARTVSARRFDQGRLAPVVRATALGTAVKSGMMTKVVPSFVGQSYPRFFVLFSADSTAILCFYDEEKDPPEMASCLGKAELAKIKGVEGKSIYKAQHALRITFNSRAVDWEIDAGSPENQTAWIEAINSEVAKAASGKPIVVAEALVSAPDTE